MSIGGSLYKLSFETNANSSLLPTRREMALLKTVTEESVSPTEKFNRSLAALDNLFDHSEMTIKEYNYAVDELAKTLPANIAAQEEASAIAAHAESVLKSLRSPVDDYNDALALNEKALKANALTQEQVNAANEMARQKLPEVSAAQKQLNADMERGKKITQSVETETEQYTREVDELSRLLRVGAINEETMARETQRLKVQLQGAENATQSMSDAMREGRSLTTSLMTAEERRAAELRKSHGLLSRGAISQETYNRHLAKSRAEHLQSIPIVGDLSSRFMGIHPAAIVAGAGIGIMAAEMRLAFGAARMLTNAVREQFKEIDELGKSARTLNIDTQDMIGMADAFDEMAGVDFGGLEKSLQQMTRRISEAATGSGEAKDALREIGLTADELNQQSPAESFKDIADGIAGVANTSDQARIAYDLFGREGINLLNVLRGGSEAIEAADLRAKELGNTLSAFDVSAVEKMNDQLGDVGDVITGMVRDLAVDVAPLLTAVGESLVEALKPGSVLGDDIRFAFETIPPVIAWAADETNQWLGGLQLMQSEALGVASSVVSALAMIDRAEAFIDPFRDVNKDLQFMAEDLRRQVDVRTNEALKRMGDGASGQMQKRVKEIRDELARAANDNQSGDTPAESEFAAQEAAAKLRGEVDQLTKSLQEQIDTYSMSADEAILYKLASQGVDDTELARIKTLQNLIDVNREFDKIEAERVAREKAVADATTNATAALQEQLDTLGMSAAEVERYKLAKQGVSDASIREIEAMQNAVTAREQEIASDKLAIDTKEKLVSDIDEYEKELRKQIDTQGMAADEVKLWELAQRGATDADLERIAALQKEAAATDELTSAIQSNFDAQKVGERSTLEGLAKARQKQIADSFAATKIPTAESDIKAKSSRVDDVRSKLAENLAKHDTAADATSGSTVVDDIRKKLAENLARHSQVDPIPSPPLDSGIRDRLPPLTLGIDAQKQLDDAMQAAFDKFNASMPTASPVAIQPIRQPIAPQPSESTKELEKQTKLQERIAKSIDGSFKFTVEEVTL